jgi:hypothetical protein
MSEQILWSLWIRQLSPTTVYETIDHGSEKDENGRFETIDFHEIEKISSSHKCIITQILRLICQYRHIISIHIQYFIILITLSVFSIPSDENVTMFTQSCSQHTHRLFQESHHNILAMCDPGGLHGLKSYLAIASLRIETMSALGLVLSRILSFVFPPAAKHLFFLAATHFGHIESHRIDYHTRTDHSASFENLL